MFMGIIGNIRQKLESKAHEIQESRAKEKAEYKEHYDKAYGKAYHAEVAKSAREKAQKDAWRKAHPVEAIQEKLKGIGGNAAEAKRGTPNRLGQKLAPLGDFGRSIGRQYDNMGHPAWMDYGMPTPSKKAKKEKPIWMP